MSKAYIPVALRRKVAITARHRCGYCQTQAILVGRKLEVEHILPEALGGSSEEANLWLACSTCNHAKWTKTTAIDPHTNVTVALFNPRQQQWNDHFAWTEAGLYVVGLSATGRATVAALDMNNAYIVRARHIWIQWGMHPPRDELAS